MRMTICGAIAIISLLSGRCVAWSDEPQKHPSSIMAQPIQKSRLDKIPAGDCQKKEISTPEADIVINEIDGFTEKPKSCSGYMLIKMKNENEIYTTKINDDELNEIFWPKHFPIFYKLGQNYVVPIWSGTPSGSGCVNIHVSLLIFDAINNVKIIPWDSFPKSEEYFNCSQDIMISKNNNNLYINVKKETIKYSQWIYHDGELKDNGYILPKLEDGFTLIDSGAYEDKHEKISTRYGDFEIKKITKPISFDFNDVHEHTTYEATNMTFSGKNIDLKKLNNEQDQNNKIDYPDEGNCDFSSTIIQEKDTDIILAGCFMDGVTGYVHQIIATNSNKIIFSHPFPLSNGREGPVSYKKTEAGIIFSVAYYSDSSEMTNFTWHHYLYRDGDIDSYRETSIRVDDDSVYALGSAWRSDLAKWLKEHKGNLETIPPNDARDWRKVGVAISRVGRVQSIVFKEGSDNNRLDDSIKTLFKGAKLPSFPDYVGKDRLTIDLTIFYYDYNRSHPISIDIPIKDEQNTEQIPEQRWAVMSFRDDACLYIDGIPSPKSFIETDMHAGILDSYDITKEENGHPSIVVVRRPTGFGMENIIMFFRNFDECQTFVKNRQDKLNKLN